MWNQGLQLNNCFQPSIEGFSYEGNGAVMDWGVPERQPVTALIACLLKKERYQSGVSAGL